MQPHFSDYLESAVLLRQPLPLCVGERGTILDGNVKRILARYFGISGYPGEKSVEERLWQLAESLLPAEESNHQIVVSYTQALMDLGALVCARSRPRCQYCPLQADCIACQNDLTADLPVPKPRKTLPVRETVHLILLDQERILLKTASFRYLGIVVFSRNVCRSGQY